MNYYKKRLEETNQALLKTIDSSIKLRIENERLKAKLKRAKNEKPNPVCRSCARGGPVLDRADNHDSLRH